VTPRIYRVGVDQRQDWLVLTDPGSYEALDRLEFSDRPSSNPILAEELRTDDFGRPTSRSDFPHLASNVLVMTAGAAHLLAPLMDSCGESARLLAGDRPLIVFRPYVALGLLDEGASEVVRFPSGRIMDIRKYRFLDESPNLHVFRLAQQPSGPVCVSGEFVERARTGGLVGPVVHEVGNN
jgi:hypothetical protein